MKCNLVCLSYQLPLIWHKTNYEWLVMLLSMPIIRVLITTVHSTYKNIVNITMERPVIVRIFGTVT